MVRNNIKKDPKTFWKYIKTKTGNYRFPNSMTYDNRS